MKTNKPVAFVLASTDHGSMIVNRNDYHKVNDTAYGVGFQLLETSHFDPQEVSTVLALLSSRREFYGDGVVAIDCGANIGVHSLEWSKHMTGWGGLIAFEAQERIFYALAGNLAINNCFNARAIWAAVGESNGSIGVPIPDYTKPASFGSLEIQQRDGTEYIGQDINYKQTQVTNMIAIDNLKLQRCDLIKIDVEGMEEQVLTGAVNTIEKHCPQLVIEKIKSNEKNLEKWLEDRDYKLFQFGLNILAIHDSDPTLSKMQHEEDETTKESGE